MTLEIVRNALGWCTLINFGFLFVWFVGIAVARDFVFKLHTKWFKNLTPEAFDGIVYGLMGLYKLAIFLFFMIPYLALRIVA